MSKETFIDKEGKVWVYDLFTTGYRSRSDPVSRWPLDRLISEAMTYPSRSKLLFHKPAVAAAFKKFPGELDRLFPKRPKVPTPTEAEIRLAAPRYGTRGGLSQYAPEMYFEALRLGIMDDLGFGPPKGGFNNMAPGHLYLANLKLYDGVIGVVLGITNKRPCDRFAPYEVALTFNRSAYLFSSGLAARKAEKHLKDTFKSFAIKPGETSIGSKEGTAGEILVGLPLESVVSELSAYCTELPTREPW